LGFVSVAPAFTVYGNLNFVILSPPAGGQAPVLREESLLAFFDPRGILRFACLPQAGSE
jgi:hypothetical protein